MPRNCYLNTRTYVTRRTSANGGSRRKLELRGAKEMAKVPGEWGEHRAPFEGIENREKFTTPYHNSFSRYSFRNFASIIWRARIRAEPCLWLRKNIGNCLEGTS